MSGQLLIALAITLLFMSEGVSLEKVYFDFFDNVINKLSDCTNVFYKMKIEDVNVLSSKATKPIIVLTDDYILEKLSCLTIFLTPDNMDMNRISNISRHIPQSTVVVFFNEEEILPTDLPTMENIIMVEHRQSGNLLLSTKCSSYKKPIQDMLWLKGQNKFYNSNLDFIKLENSCAATLKNKHVNVSVFEIFPYVVYLLDAKYTGVEMDVLDLLSQRAKFKYQVKKETSWGKIDPVTKKCNGIIRSVSEGTSQFGIAGMAIQLHACSFSSPTDFTPELYDIATMLLVPKPKPLTPFLNFLKPFTPWVWLTLALGTVLSILASLAMNAYHEDNCYDAIWQASVDFICTSLAQNVQNTLVSPKSKTLFIILGFWIVAMFFKDALYFCNLRAFILKKEYEKPIENDDDLVKSNVDLYIPAATSADDDYRFSKSRSQQIIYSRAVERKTLFEFKGGISLKDELRMVDNGAARLVLQPKVNTVLMQMEKHLGYQPYTVSKNEVSREPFGFITPRFQPWSEEINRILMRIVSAGIVDYLLRKNTPTNKYSYASTDSKEDLEPYRIEHVAGILILLAIGLFLSVIVALVERLFRAFEMWRENLIEKICTGL